VKRSFNDAQEENPAPTPVGFSCWLCTAHKDSGTQACHKAGVKVGTNHESLQTSIPEMGIPVQLLFTYASWFCCQLWDHS